LAKGDVKMKEELNMTTMNKETSTPKVFGYLPDDNPPPGAVLSLGFQQFLTMFPTGIPAIVFAAILGILFNVIFLIFKTPGVRGG